MPHTLVLLRHGNSEWNQKNLFTGWVDVPLSERGAAEAGRGGTLLAEQDLLPDIVHTSVLRRAIQTQIENPLAKQILEGRFAAKDTIKVHARKGAIVFER